MIQQFLRVPVAIDLFSGCGGISTGLLDAGIRVVAGFDHDRPSIVGFDYNHVYRGAKGHLVDLGTCSGSQILELAGQDRIDLLAGGPPCQSFSIAGKQRGLADPRGNLVFDFVRLVKEIQPTAFMFENVPSVEKFDDGHLLERIVSGLMDIGYAVASQVLAAADYGVPQMRRRLFVVGIKGARSVEFPPKATHGVNSDLFTKLLPVRTCRDALNDLPDVDSEGSWNIPNHEPTVHSPAMLAAFSVLEPGKRDSKSFHDRLHPDRPSYTLRAGTGNFSPLRPVHYLYDRVITVRESARLQGFSDDFIWPDSISRLQQYRQVGNAVPPPLALAVGRCLAQQLSWHLNPGVFIGDPSSRRPPMERTYEERRADRLYRTRGASMGRLA